MLGREQLAVWGKNFPLQYDGYKRTVDQVRTRYGTSSTTTRWPAAAIGSSSGWIFFRRDVAQQPGAERFERGGVDAGAVARGPATGRAARGRQRAAP